MNKRDQFANMYDTYILFCATGMSATPATWEAIITEINNTAQEIWSAEIDPGNRNMPPCIEYCLPDNHPDFIRL